VRVGREDGRLDSARTFKNEVRSYEMKVVGKMGRVE
jgi:hypothetical protein